MPNKKFNAPDPQSRKSLIRQVNRVGLGQENTSLHERLAYMESNIANDVARVVRSVIAKYFKQKASNLLFPMGAFNSDKLMEVESTSTSG